MTKYVHAEMIKAKADNMGLVVFRKNYDNSWGEIQCHDCCFMPDFEYFLCLPQHKEACLHWLSGGYVQLRHGKSQDWEDYGAIIDWVTGSVFMQCHCEIRIKPRKEKRWIGVCECDCTPRNFKSIDDARFWVDHNAGKNSDYWQFIEIEVEV